MVFLCVAMKESIGILRMPLHKAFSFQVCLVNLLYQEVVNSTFAHNLSAAWTMAN